ncbi:hypothetical protein PPGU19_089680 (plasmid) [Paraburkholderia sp. PGU19]|uniref:DUF3579 domain-containing protein n=1 Tax=Paraburkholderia terrae TaxID=311230 RepID=A0ABM7U0Y1_9BURK|nr:MULTISPECIES: DUF3579 domain-containing protein [Paraburkholderia]BCG04400.1 hypothetical protein PPGU19_089680 [Paraburkholderia sp. PGU19]BCZ84834.1 hypothetical protein PTKU64_85090 [Paraburkholderia terrae]BDC44807.1 hypothetical protein PTKU15_81040 [Paraburkholderia terrae]
MDRTSLTPRGFTQGMLIRGITHRQREFRPGDWAERLTGVVTLFVGERRPGMHVPATRLAMPVIDGGLKSLFVADELRSVCPGAFEFVMRFAEDNDLSITVHAAPVFSVP